MTVTVSDNFVPALVAFDTTASAPVVIPHIQGNMPTQLATIADVQAHSSVVITGLPAGAYANGRITWTMPDGSVFTVTGSLVTPPPVVVPPVTPPPVVVPPVTPPPVVVPPVTPLSVTAGPLGQYPYITSAMQAIGPLAWFDANGTQLPNPSPAVVTILPAPAGYYDRDCGNYSPKFSSMPGIAHASPPWAQELFGPMTVAGQAGSPPPVLSTLGGDASATTALYYSKGFFNLQDHDYTFRNLVFRQLRGLDGNRELNGIRGEAIPRAAAPRTWLFEDVWFDDCDTGFLGGSPGQTLIFRRCRFTNCGISTGDLAGFTHNIYVGQADLVVFQDCLSTNSLVGHLIKSRTNVTFLGTNRLIGDGIPGTARPCTASYCLDTPCAGTVNIPVGSHLILAMAETPSNGICWHFGGEPSAGDKQLPGVVNIAGKLTMIGNSKQSWTNNAGTSYPIVGFRDDTGSIAGAVPTVFNVTGSVEVFNIPAGSEGFPVVTRLTARPSLDLSSPCLTTLPS